jgi:hypothetical protein
MSFFGGFKLGFTSFGHRVNSVVTAAVLVMVYVIGIGFTTLLGRIAGKKFMDMNPGGESYWTDVEQKEETLDDCRRSF